MVKTKRKNKEKKSEKKKEAEKPEEKIDEAEEEYEEEPKIVESFLKSIPLFGDFFKELGKTDVFKKRFEEANKQIQENLQRGERKGWGWQAHISTRPIIREPLVKKKKEEEAAVFYGKDYQYMKKGNMLALVVKVPGKNVQIKLEDDKLILRDKGWEKIINLPDRYRTIREKQYKKNILALKLTK